MAPAHPVSYTCIRYSLLTDQILEKCSNLFNKNYGIWSDDAPVHSNNKLQAGTPVKLGVKRLREMMLFNDACFLVTAEIRSFDTNQFELIGHAFCTWTKYDRLNGNVVWITQLVVSSSYRGQGVAGTLLSMAKNSIEDVVATGLDTSHPHAVIALRNACNGIPIDLKFIADHGKDIIRACNIPYLSHAQFVGSIFNNQSVLPVNNDQQPVSLVKTDFFVDHKEVLVILKDIREKWNLGPLLDGHEFLVVLPTTSVRHSKTSSNGSSSDTSP
ncbi:unnamed protein product [Rotaria sp. Silwood1]|nr:unnamed protein product [Rotaria sp. Silwood1]CAF1678258.1 unnamed protein product [Rotaria sp. Silwood1]